MSFLSYYGYVAVAIVIAWWILRRLWRPLRGRHRGRLASAMGGSLLILMGLIIVVLVYGSERNNRALINSLIISAILIAIAVGIFYAVRSQGFALRVVGALFSLALIGAAIGRSCSTPVGDSVRYAALGDSYASGEGARVSGHPYVNRLEYGPAADGSTDDPRCHRSTEAYPGVLADHVGRTSLLFTACSGAEIADLTTTAQYAATPPQLETLKRFVASGTPD